MNLKKHNTRLLYLSAFLVLFGSCSKEQLTEGTGKPGNTTNVQHSVSDNALTQTTAIAHVRTLEDGTNQIMFLNNAQVFNVYDSGVWTKAKELFAAKKAVKITFDPWGSELQDIKEENGSAIATLVQPSSQASTGVKLDVSSMEDEEINSVERLGIINTSAPDMGLVNVVPDMATAQLMFNYMATQCCAIPGPYTIDYCISFQYAYDGCYARAHKMCDILNKKYHYQTHKIFSFANAGADVLSVKGDKWGGCCINWWYHVAPLVNVKTPSGVKAYVFDPSMFNQPVLLSVWLHAQENPACASWGVANVSMINIQPTASYSPSDYSGYYFSTDPTFSSTNSTLVSYAPLTTCP